MGPGSLEGAYLYSQTGDTRTYDIRYVHGLDEQGEFEWSTNGEEGSQLVIVNEGKVEGVKVYTLRLEQFDLNYGQWDFLNGNWNSFGIKGFNFQEVRIRFKRLDMPYNFLFFFLGITI